MSTSRSCWLLRSELTCEIDKLKMHLESSEKEMASLEKQVRLQTSVETLELRCELEKQQLKLAKVQEVNVGLEKREEMEISVKVSQEVEARCKQVKQEVEELRTQNEVYEKHLEEGEKYYEKQYETWKESSDKLLAQMAESHKQEMSKVVNLEKKHFDRQVDLQKQNRESQIADLQASHALQIGQFAQQMNELKEEVSKSKSTTNTSQGQEGEVEVASLFQTAMSGSIVEWEETTSIEGSGDGKAIISRNDEEYVVLVEAKNVKVLHSKHDTAKFHKDVAKQKPDFALMISIQEKSIPKMYKLEFIECIPTITIESRCENLIRLCVDYLVYLAQSKRQERKERKGAARFSEHIDLLFTHILDLELSLQEKADNIEAARKLLNADRTRILYMRMQMDRFLNIYPAHTAKSTMDLAVDEIKPELNKKSDYVHREQLELFNRAGGFPTVKAEFKKRKLHHCEPG